MLSADNPQQGRYALANPPKFTQTYDFSDYQVSNPSTPLPGVQVDIQLAAIEEVSIAVRDSIMDVRRSDGALKNEIVTEDSLAPGLIDILTAQTGADAVNDAVDEAEAFAAAAAATAAENQSLQTSLEAAIDAFETGGVYGDYGSITEASETTDDYGSIV